MKFITKVLAAAIVSVALPHIGLAQEINGIENQKGYEISKETGVVSKLKQLEKKSLRNNQLVSDPQKRTTFRLGMRDLDITPKSGMDTDYDFYGGISERGNNVAMASVTDAEGNTYMTGGSSNLEQQSGDLFTIKISPAGTVLWEIREPAVTFAVDTGMEIALDPDGNPVVSGTLWNGTNTDMQTIKYNAESGAVIWESIYEGPGEGLDVPTNILIDATGNVIVAAITWSGDSIDYLTVKYGPDGTKLWEAANNPAGTDAWNEPTALAMDAEGNIIVTGYSPDEVGWVNYYTVKYTATGELVWAQPHAFQNHEDEEDPDSPLIPTNSVPEDVVTDADGNIYVTGTFDTFSDRAGTIKYNAAGTEQWVNIYKNADESANAYAIAIKDNTLYVAGRHYGIENQDGTALLSYNLNGTLNWVKETDDYTQINDIKLTFDSDANPVIAGYGTQIGESSPMFKDDTVVRATKYAVNGDLIAESQFVIAYTGTAGIQSLLDISISADNSVHYAINSFYSEIGAAFEALKVNFGGTASIAAWDAINSNTGGFNASMFNAVPDSQGNTYTTGAYYKFNAEEVQLDPTYFVLKYNVDGSIAWQKTYDASNGNAAYGIIVNTDSSDNLLIALLPHRNQSEGELKLKKYSPDGTLLWETTKAVKNAAIMTVQTADDGSVYAAGTAKENAEDFAPKFAVVKYTADGAEAWTSYLGNGDEDANYFNLSTGKTDADGNFYFTGTSGLDSMMFDDIDLTVVKLNPDGTATWTAIAPVEGFYGSGNDLVLAGDGNIYVSGLGVRSSGNFDDDMLTAKISAEGAVLWTKIVGEPDRHERALSLKKLSTGDIVAAGYSQAMQGASIYDMVIRYDAEGNDVWTYQSESRRFFNDFHVDGSDKCYILNQAQISTVPFRLQTGPFPVASLIVIDTDGTAEEQFFIGPAYSETYAAILVPHQDDRLLLAGSLTNQSFYEGIYFFETEHDGTLGTNNPGQQDKQSNYLGQNYPNPVTNETDIPFFLVDGGQASIKLYNAQGRFVKEIANDTFSPGQNTVHFEASGLSTGIYFYQIVSGKFKQGRKMIITN